MTTGRINQVAIQQGYIVSYPFGKGILAKDAAILLDKFCSALLCTGNPRGRDTLTSSGGQPLYLCHVFTLLHPSKLQAYQCDCQVHGMPTRYIREECFFRISRSILGQRPSGTTSIYSLAASVETTWPQCDHFMLSLGSESAQHRSSLLNMPQFRTREHFTEQGLLIRTNYS